MSDWYDSLEDESDEKNSLPDSLNDPKTTNALNALTDAKENKSAGVYLNRRVINNNKIPNLNYQFDETENQKPNFLPKIETPTKGWTTTSNLIIDKQILKEQGLQLNKDGSFTKSPRSIAEELPFITREYRNLQFQKKKTYKLKKTPRVQKNKSWKSPCDDANKIATCHKKNINENIITDSGSSSSRLAKHIKFTKLLENDNLTDAMKEKLLQSNRNSPHERFQMMGGLKKVKRVLNLLEAPKNIQNKIQSPKKIFSERKQGSFCTDHSIGNDKKNKVIGEHHSDIALKTSLSYSERQQMKNGFNPVHLRLGSKKMITDTNRSNFGDSAVENLSEISSRVLSQENILEEGEESFYRELMEKDKKEKLFQRTSRSDGTNNSAERNFPKEQKEVKLNNLRCKSITKPMYIDLPSDSDQIVSPVKKITHYCSKENSSKMSKYELALKGKTYGYLANARNIFKMKAQSEGKLIAKDGNKNSKVSEKNTSSLKKPTGSGQVSQKFLPEVSKTVEKISDVKKTPPTTENVETTDNSSSGFSLPRIFCPEKKEIRFKSDLFKQVSECLAIPNGAIENMSRPLPDKAVQYSLKTV